MTDSPYNADGLQFAFDSTTLRDADKCLRYYQLRHLEGWEGRGINPHLFFGILYATSLEHYHKYLAAGDDHDTALRKIVRETLIATWLDGEPWESSHGSKTRDNLIRTIVWYTEHFKEDPTTVVKLADGKPAVELSARFEVDDGIVFCGHMDRLVEFGDKLYVMDQKTTGSTIAPYYFEQYANDSQMSMYTFLGKAVYHMPVRGVIIDAAQVAVGFTRYERAFTFRTEDQLEEWYVDMMKLIGRIHEAHKSGYFPMRRESCNNYGGCAFRSVCSRPASLRENFLKGDFQKREPWNPLRSR